MRPRLDDPATADGTWWDVTVTEGDVSERVSVPAQMATDADSDDGWLHEAAIRRFREIRLDKAKAAEKAAKAAAAQDQPGAKGAGP